MPGGHVPEAGPGLAAAPGPAGRRAAAARRHLGGQQAAVPEQVRRGGRRLIGQKQVLLLASRGEGRALGHEGPWCPKSTTKNHEKKYF